MGYLFVSYSRWDREGDPQINRLLDELRAAGVRLWLVPDDAPPGADWKTSIQHAIGQADGLLYLGTRSIKATPQIRRELDTAVRYGLPIFSALLRPLADDDLPTLPAHPNRFELHTDYSSELANLIKALPGSVKASQPLADTAPRAKGYVFISYAEEDTNFVSTLRQFLKERGYGYWDYQDSDRNYQSQLFLELEAVIQNASATISVLSPDWKRSAWAAKEYLFSEQIGTPVFLVMARDMGPTLVTAGVPYIDFVRDPQRGFEKLDRELRRKGLI